MIILTILAVFLWRQTYNLMELYGVNENIGRNYISSLHQFGLLFCEIEHLSLIKVFSMGYFIEDSLFKIEFKSWRSISNIVLVIHHIIAVIFYLSLDSLDQSTQDLALKALVWAEISNVPGNLVYHYIKTYGRETGSFVWLQLGQSIIYSSIRVVYLGYCLYVVYYESYHSHSTLVTLFGFIYLMGLYWSAVLWQQSIDGLSKINLCLGGY